MFLPEFDRAYLSEKGYIFEEKNSAGRNGLIIKDWLLPAGKFNPQSSNLLILIPQGYPEIKPDMWYFYPYIFLLPNNRTAKQTEARIEFDGKSWQRWSRHYPANEWRSGIDGIHTYLMKIKYALETAK